MIELCISKTGYSARFTSFPSRLRGEWKDHFISDGLSVASRCTPVCSMGTGGVRLHLMPGEVCRPDSDTVSGFYTDPVGYITATIYYATIKNQRFRIIQKEEENE